MKYLVATFQITGSSALWQTAHDLIADAAGEAGFESFEDTPDGICGYVQENLYDEALLKRNIMDLPLNGITVSYHITPVQDKNWNETWENEGFAPINVSDKILIYDAKHGTAQDYDNDKFLFCIGIETQLAFGTGTHQTTQMILHALLGLDLRGKTVLDCGCGTGILSIAASKLGAEKVIAYDIDEWSVNNTKHNAMLNQVSNIEVFHGNASILSHICESFDVVLANINRNVLLEDMATIHKVMKQNARLILSGFYEKDIQLLLNRSQELGIKSLEINTKDKWSCLLLQNDSIL